MSFDLSENVIDSRDIIAEIERLESEIEDLETEKDDLETDIAEIREETDLGEGDESLADQYKRAAEIDDELADLKEELKPLKDIEDQCEGYCDDWRHGASLISENYFTEYAEELACDCGMITGDSCAWPLNCIDWDVAADELKQDYTTVEIDDYTFYVR